MSIDIDNLFAGMATKEINGSGTYMGDGLYKIQTRNLFIKKGQNPAKPGDSFICEFEILESNNAAHAIGSTGSYVLKMSNPYAMGNIVELVMALLGFHNTKENQTNTLIREQVAIVTRAALGSPSGKTELEALREGLEDRTFGVLTGVPLRLECTKKPTAPKAGKPEGGEFTVHRWSPLAS